MNNVQFRTLVACTALGLAACMPKPDAMTPAPQPGEPTCQAAAFADLVGQPADAAVIVPGPKRFIPPNAAVTTDYIANRINISLNKKGRITDLSCG